MNKSIDISNVKLYTKRLELRPFKEEDLMDLNEYAKVDGVGEMAGWHHHETIEESKRVLNLFIEGKRVFAITLNNKVIGSLGIEEYKEEEFKEFDNLFGREIGFVLSKDYWGQGLIKESAEEVISYLFKTVKLDFIMCGYFLNNFQSKRVQEKIGFIPYKEIDYTDRMGNVNRAQMSILYKKDYIKG